MRGLLPSPVPLSDVLYRFSELAAPPAEKLSGCIPAFVGEVPLNIPDVFLLSALPRLLRLRWGTGSDRDGDPGDVAAHASCGTAVSSSSTDLPRLVSNFERLGESGPPSAVLLRALLGGGTFPSSVENLDLLGLLILKSNTSLLSFSSSSRFRFSPSFDIIFPTLLGLTVAESDDRMLFGGEKVPSPSSAEGACLAQESGAFPFSNSSKLIPSRSRSFAVLIGVFAFPDMVRI